MSGHPVTKKKLEIYLESVPKMEDTGPKKEQYMTPATLAADMVFTAYAHGSVAGREILDLGCGTGILGIAASLLGAGRVVGVDCEKAFLTQLRRFAAGNNLHVDAICADVETLCFRASSQNERFVTIQNPPFGAQFSGRGNDRMFLTQAFKWSDEVYSLHKLETEGFLQKFAHKARFQITLLTSYSFPLPHQFQFHRKEKEFIEVGFFCFSRKAK